MIYTLATVLCIISFVLLTIGAFWGDKIYEKIQDSKTKRLNKATLEENSGKKADVLVEQDLDSKAKAELDSAINFNGGKNTNTIDNKSDETDVKTK